jgi:hypothetical protein
MKSISRFLLLALAFALLAAACSRAPEIPTLTPTLTNTATSTALPTSTATSTITPTSTPTLTPTIDPSWIFFESEWLTLYYPPDWTLEKPREHACMPGSTDCIIRLSHSESESIEIEFIRYPPGVPELANVNAADQWYWQNTTLSATIINAKDHLKLLSRTNINVGERAAVKRLYEYPLVDPATNKIFGTQYTYQVLVMNGKDLYDFRMTTKNSDEFEKYTEIADELIKTIVFSK